MEKHEYHNGEITILWQPKLCVHAGICVKTLSKVYNPKGRPWIKAENATTQELIWSVEYKKIKKWRGRNFYRKG